VAATALVLVVGLLALWIAAWSHSAESDARAGPYTATVALATARIDGFDAKSAESLTLIAHGSGQAYEDRFKVVSADALAALSRDLSFASRTNDELQVSQAFDNYVKQHVLVRAADDGGKFDDAVSSATGKGAANQAFAAFEARSSTVLGARAKQLSDDLDHARFPLIALAWVILVAGLAAAFLARRGIAQRLQEYR
jgi:hypothetical protein